MFTRRDFLRNSGLLSVYLALAGGATPLLANDSHATLRATLADAALWSELADSESAPFVHLCNRLTWGPRPGDVQAVMALGYDAFVEAQLHPEEIDDHVVESMLSDLSALQMSSAELWLAYPAKGSNPPTHIIEQLQSATIQRALYSKRQLFEIMVDFWSNHFNIDVVKKRGRWLKVADDRDVIRRHALGKFRDLLVASAHSPAMLVSLDNNENTAPGVMWGDQPGGINENYARELMELHTVGVDGGYTQQDVQVVALALTGWGVASPKEKEPLSFIFRDELHDPSEKSIPFLGLTLPANGGSADGEDLLAALAVHPNTARHIAYKLAVTFVADAPPPSLVARLAQVYLANDTDIRATLSALFHSDEFKESAGQKFKLPLRFMVSALRALDAQCNNLETLRTALLGLGQPLFGWSAPNGYPQIGAAWVNSGGLLARWNLAFALAETSLDGVSYDSTRLAAHKKTPAGDLVDNVSAALLNGELTADQRALLVDFVSGGKGAGQPVTKKQIANKSAELAALLLASPLFQLH